MPMLSAKLFTVPNIWNQLRFLSVYEYKKKISYIYIIEYYSSIKRIMFCHLRQNGWNEDIMLSEINHAKDTCYIVLKHMNV